VSRGRFAGCLAYRTRKVLFGHERTVVLTYNEHLLDGQLLGINASLLKARRKLDQLQTPLLCPHEGRVKGGQSPIAHTVSGRMDTILRSQFRNSLLRCDVASGSVPTLTYRTDTATFSRSVWTQLRKTTLLTDNDSWTNEEIVAAYRAQSQIESAFRDVKHPHFLGWSPMCHWTESAAKWLPSAGHRPVADWRTPLPPSGVVAEPRARTPPLTDSCCVGLLGRRSRSPYVGWQAAGPRSATQCSHPGNCR